MIRLRDMREMASFGSPGRGEDAGIGKAAHQFNCDLFHSQPISPRGAKGVQDLTRNLLTSVGGDDRRVS